MLIYAWLLLNSLTIVKLQHVALPRKARAAECRDIDLHRIKEYFAKTTIIRNEDTTEVHYCASINEWSTNSSNTTIDLDTVIELYSTLEFVNSFMYIHPQGPVTSDGVLSINDYEHLPLYQIADIRKKHLACINSYPGFQDEVNTQMKLMGIRNTDVRALLLAHSLGGIPSAINVIPIASNIYWHLNSETKDAGLGKPLSNWRSNEYWIRRFLLHFYPNGRVVWKIAVQYEENIFVNPKKFRSYRPLSFSLQYTAYTDQHNDSSLYYESPKLTFLNDNHFTCKSVFQCHKEFDLRANYASKCDVQMPKLVEKPKSVIRFRAAKFQDLNNKPLEKIGPTLGHGKWSSRHLVAFTYVVEDKTYFYAHHDNLKWSIHEVLSGGKMGEETDNGTWVASFKYSFPYFMNGKQYMYAHSFDMHPNSNKEETAIRVRELLPFGKMGHLTFRADWPGHILNCVPFSINGRHFYLAQTAWYSYFIRELMPDVIIFREEHMSGHNWQRRKLFFPCTINNRLMFFIYTPEMTDWSIQPILPDGKIQLDALYQGHWESGYDVAFAYSSGGKQLIYGLSTKPPYPWFIRELLPNGTISNKLSYNNEDGSYHIAFPFSKNGRQYIYKQNKQTFAWKINELL